jgi:GT2 family glycosyltransferase
VIHDSEAALERLLRSIEVHLDPAPELVVVDSGSSDAGAALAAQRGARVLSLDGNPGYGPANNVGLASARGDVAVLLNPDTELIDGSLMKLVARARARDALFAGALIGPDGRTQKTAHPTPGAVGTLAWALAPTGALPRALRERSEPWRAWSEREVGWAIGACLAGRSGTLRSLGPFDPDAFLFYEDLDLCLRARRAGVPTMLVPEVRLRHEGAHATGRVYGGEPYLLLARRRREVVAGVLGDQALRIDDLAQGLTFLTRAVAHAALGHDARAPAARLRALREVRREARRGGRGSTTQNRPS